MYNFIGEGGSLDNPESVFRSLTAPKHAPETLHGKEAVGAMRFSEKTLNSRETATYIVLHGITDNENDIETWQDRFNTELKVNQLLQKSLEHWQLISNAVSFNTADKTFDNWAKWVTFQLKCRQIFGNSYLPDFGYGRGGRGWRDLWQDLLSIFLVDPISARDEILNNFRGIRVDGSNATIIGTKPGEFIADRNNVPRTWCDHAAWPVFVLDFYIHQTGDYDILFKDLPYWKDIFTYRSKNKDSAWESSQGFAQLDENNDNYLGSVLEHILLQQLTAFFNVGDNNNLLLEGGDWNDTLDMARQKGESVCFHNFYAYNLSVLANILEHLHGKGYETLYLLSEILLLLDRLPNQQKVDYQSPEAKQTRLERYFHKVEHVVSGSKAQVNIRDLMADLREKSAHIVEHIRKNEWIETSDGYRFFNGHYDNDGLAIHGDSEVGVLMDLTSQVLPIMCNVASNEQISESVRSIKKYLKDSESPGIRLCTDFKELNLNIGRITGFTYGYKEHGSKWSQQNIMLMYGLYKRGFVADGAEIFREIYQLSVDSGKSLIFPGIPSYFEPGDRGAYAYLTGSSTWLLLALTTQIFGVDGHFGDLVINPKLDPSFFGHDNTATISRRFRDLNLTVTFKNEHRKAFPHFSIGKIFVNGINVPEVETKSQGKILPYDLLMKLSQNRQCAIEVELG
jgi:cellobiose phosphorylase